MKAHRALAPRTGSPSMTRLQIAVIEIVPQGISIALAMRELIRQAYLYPAAILMRPLVERTGMVFYLCENKEMVEQWHSGWSRKFQPKFEELLNLVMDFDSADECESVQKMLHTLVHSDPASAIWNATTRSDGSQGSAVGKELNEPVKADAISAFVTRCLDHITRMSLKVLAPDLSPSGIESREC